MATVVQKWGKGLVVTEQMLHGVAAARGLRAASGGLSLVQVLSTQEMQLSLMLYSHLT